MYSYLVTLKIRIITLATPHGALLIKAVLYK